MSLTTPRPLCAPGAPRLSVHRPDGAHPTPERMATRRDQLAHEARRLLRRRATARALASRCAPGVHGLSAREAETLSHRARRRAADRHMKFLRAIEGLIEFGGFVEAMSLMRSSRG